MRVGDNNSRNGWIVGNRRRSSILGAQWKRGRPNVLDGLGGKVAGDSSEGAIPKIVKYSETCSEDRTPIRSLAELIGESQSRRHIPISRVVERSATRRQTYRRWVIEPHHCERIVRQILAS